MYIPKAFEETRLPVLHDLMRTQPFASLVTLGSSGLFATHLPMVLKEDGSRFGVLNAHLSRANTQWREFTAEVQALVIFSGPQHYITPTWYPEKQATGKVVPTWNYAVVHAYGFLKIVEDADWLLAHLESLTTIHEASSSEPWQVSDAPANYIASQVRGIVGLELQIERLEGKWKFNQNRSDADRRGVAQGLEAIGSASSEAVEKLVRETF